MIDKTVGSFDEAVADIHPGAIVHFGGFASPFNTPNYLIAALARQGADELTAISTFSGYGQRYGAQVALAKSDIVEWPDDGWDLGLLVELRRVKKMITSFPTGNRRTIVYPFEQLLEEGVAEVEVIGQGSLAERIRCARAGIPAFYTPVGVGTFVAEGKEVRDFDGVPHILETALHADFAVIRAHRADRHGNLLMQGPRTFNQTMAGAATVTIAEVDEIVDVGGIEASEVHVPSVYVQRVVCRPAQPAASWKDTPSTEKRRWPSR